MDEEFKNKILKDIQKNGYLQELQVGKILAEKGCYVMYNQYYADPDTQKSREIDVFGIMHVGLDHRTKINFVIKFIVEVKSSKKPWVFFCSKNSYLSLDHTGNSWLIRENVPSTGISFFTGHPRYGIDYKANSFYEAFKEHSDESMIYKALLSATKATHAFFKLENSILSKRHQSLESTSFDLNKSSQITLYIPLVVLDGVLLRGYLDKVDFQLEEASYVTTNHSLFNNNEFGSHYPIDIVKIDYLNDYIDNLMSWAENALLTIHDARMKMK